MATNEQVAAGGTGVTVNPTQYSIPTEGLWRGNGDTLGDNIYKTNADGTYTVYNLSSLRAPGQGGNSIGALMSQYGLDFNSLPAFNYGDVFQAAAAAGKIRPNSAGTGYEWGVSTGSLADLAKPAQQAGTTQSAAFNTTASLPANPTEIAKATAAQTQQLAGNQGMNVTQTTTPEGVSAVQKTPLGTPAAQTTATQTGSPQSPSSTAGAAAGAINYQKLPNETIDQYNARIAASGGPSAPTGTSTGAAGAIDTNYQMKPGETIDSYNARIAAYNASKPVTQPTGQPGASGTMAQTGGANDPYAGLDPIQKQVKMYTDAYKALGLDTIKQQFDDYAKQQADLTDEMNKKIQDTQNNPWLSQGVVDKTVQRIKDSYATKLDTLTHLLTLTDSLYKQGQAQVDHMVSDANADIKATNDLAQKQIDAANALAKDNQVVSINGREVLVSKATGKAIADLGPTSSVDTLAEKEQLAAFTKALSANNPTGTAAERQQATIDKIGQLFVPGATIPGSGGVPFLDSNGNATPEGWKTALDASGLSRATFIKEFGNLIVNNGGTVSPKYGLTPVEIKSLTGSI